MKVYLKFNRCGEVTPSQAIDAADSRPASDKTRWQNTVIPHARSDYLEEVLDIEEARVDARGRLVAFAGDEDLGGRVTRRHRLGRVHAVEQLVEGVQESVVVLRPALTFSQALRGYISDGKMASSAS